MAYWLTQGEPSWRQRIEAVAIDPHAGYLKGIASVLPDVAVTVDHFHAVKLANAVAEHRAIQRHLVDGVFAASAPKYRTTASHSRRL